MRAPLVAAVTALSLACSALAVPLAERQIQTYLPPSQDPFYRPPASFASAQNGAILASRKVGTYFDLLADATYQVLYKTTAATGEADATVATLFRPKNALSPPRIMLLLSPTDSASVDCQTSYALVAHRNPFNATLTVATAVNAATNGLDLLAGLAKGWYVAVPDHEGSKAAFISGVTEAFAGLDGLRAMLNHRETLPSADGYKAVIHGYSGGGHASAWATQFLPTYGSGLNVVAAAYGGVPIDLRVTFDHLDRNLFGSLAISALQGMANAYPELQTWLDTAVSSAGRTAFQRAKTDCNSFVAAPFVDLDSLFTAGGAALEETIPKKYFAIGSLGRPLDAPGASTNGQIASIPVFQYHSRSDQIVSYDPVPSYFSAQCAGGANLQLGTTLLSEHITALIAFLGDAYIFMNNAFEGRLGNRGCSQRNTIVAPLFSRAYIEAVGEQAWRQILGLNQRKVGGEEIHL
ncbi:uncharacterized protein JCM10292_000732 [Rhodotorula paludigena]|uniref:uncharacterized protein n=1 Tax=Rhodotorula paludigena TaxID=86838 RepID=UPI00317ED0BA